MYIRNKANESRATNRGVKTSWRLTLKSPICYHNIEKKIQINRAQKKIFCILGAPILFSFIVKGLNKTMQYTNIICINLSIPGSPPN